LNHMVSFIISYAGESSRNFFTTSIARAAT
jgi:hypothetical protein